MLDFENQLVAGFYRFILKGRRPWKNIDDDGQNFRALSGSKLLHGFSIEQTLHYIVYLSRLLQCITLAFNQCYQNKDFIKVPIRALIVRVFLECFGSIC